jgi:hypothetical protein
MPSYAAARRRRARNSAGLAVLLAGGAVGALTIAQSSIAALDPGPTTAATILVTLTVSCLGLVARRAQTLKQRQEILDQLLRYWPLTKLTDIDRHELGVSPSGLDDANYISREIDRELDQALASERFIVISGPAYAGKSRAAYEAALRFDKDRKVAIPENDEAFGDLWPLVDRARGSSPIFLWLDGLERYLAAISGDVLDEVAEADPPITLVATLRDQEYMQAIKGSDERTRGARDLVDRAWGFELPARLRGNEIASARTLYPDVDFDRPVGEVFAKRLAGRHMPHRFESEGEAGPGRLAYLHDRWLVIPTITLIALLVGVGALVFTGDFLKEE